MALLVAAVLVTACGDSAFNPPPNPQYQAAPQLQAQPDGSHAAAPAPVQQPQAQAPDSGISWGSVAAGAVGGYLLGMAMQPSAPPPQQSVREVVRETRYIERPARPVPAQSPAAKPPAFTAPTPPAPSAPPVPKPNVVVPKFTPPPPAPTKYGGPSGYSSVTQSRPSYSSTPSRSGTSSSRR